MNIREAQTVVAIGSEAPTSDATVASTVLAVGVACGGFSDRTVVAEVDDPAAAETLARACAGEVEVVGDDVIADALAAWMVKPGTAGLVRELLSFEDVRLALCELPASYGRPFASVVGAIEHASPIGIRRSDGTFAFVPAPETVLASGDRLVCLTDGLPPRWIGAPDTTGGPGPPPLASAPMPQRLMVIGWNRLAPGVFRELDRFVAAGSEVCLLCDSDLVTEREIVLPPLRHLAVTVIRVSEPEREVVSVLAQRPCSAIAVLAHQGLAPTDADAVTLATLMAVRQASPANGAEDPHVVAELTDNKHANLAAVACAMRVFLVLLEGRDSADPFFLQIKQAGSSVYEAYCGESRHANHGERVVVGKRLIQSATDIFAGWTTMAGNDFYVRQFRDMKVIPSGALIAPVLAEFATACGRVLARAHARTGDPIAIAAYIGKGRRFDDAVGGFAVSYADQTTRDHRALAGAVRAAGRPESPET